MLANSTLFKSQDLKSFPSLNFADVKDYAKESFCCDYMGKAYKFFNVSSYGMARLLRLVAIKSQDVAECGSALQCVAKTKFLQSMETIGLKFYSTLGNSATLVTNPLF